MKERLPVLATTALLAALAPVKNAEYPSGNRFRRSSWNGYASFDNFSTGLQHHNLSSIPECSPSQVSIHTGQLFNPLSTMLSPALDKEHAVLVNLLCMQMHNFEGSRCAVQYLRASAATPHRSSTVGEYYMQAARKHGPGPASGIVPIRPTKGLRQRMQAEPRKLTLSNVGEVTHGLRQQELKCLKQGAETVTKAARQ